MKKENNVLKTVRGIGGIDIGVAVGEIKRIEKKYGRIKPETLIKENSKHGAPLYDFFEWDESVGAEKWRLQQARFLLRSIVIEKQIKGSQEPMRITLFHSASDEDGKAYFSLDRLATDVDLFFSAVESMRSLVSGFQRSLSSLNSIAPASKRPVVKQIGKAVKTVEKLTDKLKE